MYSVSTVTWQHRGGYNQHVKLIQQYWIFFFFLYFFFDEYIITIGRLTGIYCTLYSLFNHGIHTDNDLYGIFLSYSPVQVVLFVRLLVIITIVLKN